MTPRKIGAMTRQETAANARAARMLKIPPMPLRFWQKVDQRGPDECWPWTAAVRRKDEGYGAFFMNGKHNPASRIAWELTFGPIPAGQQALHRCDNPKCCNPAHIFLGTNLENNADKVAKKRHCFGSKNGVALLTEEQAREIKALRPPPGTKCSTADREAIAAKFGIAPATIYTVWNKSWKHV